ncbi:hypothetical protein, partial [Streptomyces sp. NRRL WC-3549]|uniref:hypothetical protein n=1 Tax=Streptomyces sp. NRRL WC-3549 TaxID=1463925 RepID=UPI001F34C91E
MAEHLSHLIADQLKCQPLTLCGGYRTHPVGIVRGAAGLGVAALLAEAPDRLSYERPKHRGHVVRQGVLTQHGEVKGDGDDNRLVDQGSGRVEEAE